MQTHDMTTYVTKTDEEVERSYGSPFTVGKCLFRVTFLPLAFTVRSVRSYVRSVQWASQPSKHRKTEQPHPGVVLEFMLVASLLVCGLMSTLI